MLMRALRDMNLPKFVFEDVPLFLGLIQDLFPGIDCPRVRYPNFNDAVEETLTKNKYIMLPDQVGTFSSYSYFYFWICIGNYFAIDTGDSVRTRPGTMARIWTIYCTIRKNMESMELFIYLFIYIFITF